MLGERGAGKTTALHQLQLALRGERDRRPVFVDLAAADSPGAALAALAATAGEALGSPPAWGPPAPLRPGESERDHAVRVALEQLAALERCTFLIDNIRAEEVAYPLFGTYRDRIWDTPHRWIVSGAEGDRRRLLRPPADAFWEETVELRYPPSAALELISRRLGATPAWLESIVGEVGTNPRLLLRAALAARRDGEHSQPVLAEWEAWQRKVAELDRRSSMLMAELASRPPVSASDPELLASLGWARTSLIRALEELEQQGLVESWNEPGATGRPRRLFTTTEPGREHRV